MTIRVVGMTIRGGGRDDNPSRIPVSVGTPWRAFFYFLFACRRRGLEWLGFYCLHRGKFMDYLLKTEPTVYSFADLQREQSTVWDGVTNPVAVKHLREMKAGDRLVIYETGDHKSAVGTASVVSVDASDAKTPLVKIKVGKALPKPVTLAEVRAHKLFAESPLVRQGRLSVVPLNKEQFKFLTGE
jgi:predicted RNA-binding protein with PUA-like domain